MKLTNYIFLASLFLLISCKSNFEKIRASNDPVKVLAAAEKYYDQEDYLKAQTLYEQVIPFYRGKKEAEELFFKFAYTHFYLKEYILSAHYFKNYSNTFINSIKREEAAYMSAISNYRLSPRFRLDQSYSDVAIEELQGFINTFPSSPRVDEANELIDEMRGKRELKAFDQGKLYYDLKNYNSAITSFESMLKDFPETKRAEEVKYLIIKSSANWAAKSIYEKREDRLKSTIGLIEKFKKKYKASEYSKDCQNIYDQCVVDLKKFEND